VVVPSYLKLGSRCCSTFIRVADIARFASCTIKHEFCRRVPLWNKPGTRHTSCTVTSWHKQVSYRDRKYTSRPRTLHCMSICSHRPHRGNSTQLNRAVAWPQCPSPVEFS